MFLLTRFICVVICCDVLCCVVMCYDGNMSTVIAVVNLKGGVGKTTTSVHLAAIASRDQPTVLIDSDPQGSAAEWTDDLQLSNLELIEAPSARTLRSALARVGDRLVVVVDTPPGQPEIAMAALEAADVVVIPTRAGVLEIQRVALTLRLVPAGTPRYLLLTAANPRTLAHRETVQAWIDAGETIIGTIRARTAVAAGTELDTQACAEYGAVLETLLAQLNTSQPITTHHNL
jgi:chromosome partitioning protein